MENQRLTCDSCQSEVTTESLHHSLRSGFTLCTQCFRAEVRSALLREQRRDKDKATSCEGKAMKTTKARLESRIYNLSIAVRVRRETLEEKKRNMEAIAVDISRLQRVVQTLIGERIRLHYRLSSMIQLDRTQSALCPSCYLSIDAPSLKRQRSSFVIQSRSISRVSEDTRCRCVCM